MDDIDFIKWMCEKAEGFEWSCKGFLVCPDAYLFSEKKGFDGNKWDDIYHPLLLQRAIEGVNDKFSIEDDGYAILQTEQGITIYFAYHIEKTFKFSDFLTKGQAKESALRYIYEQEQG